MRSCKVDDCDRKFYAKGACSMHYQRMKNYGSYDDPRPTARERFWEKVARAGVADCWPWLAGRDSHGYGVYRNMGAHRVAYELEVGPIPDGKHLDHTCHNRDTTCPGGQGCQHRRCVNPSHLNPIEPTENQFLSGRSPAALNKMKTHCLLGHEFTPENTRIQSGRRVCLTCKRIRARFCSAVGGTPPANA